MDSQNRCPPGIRTYPRLADAVEVACGDRIRASTAGAQEVWSALADVYWTYGDHDPILSGHGGAADVVARIWNSRRLHGHLNGANFRGYSRPGVMAPWIEKAMAAIGWRWSLEEKEFEDRLSRDIGEIRSSSE